LYGFRLKYWCLRKSLQNIINLLDNEQRKENLRKCLEEFLKDKNTTLLRSKLIAVTEEIGRASVSDPDRRAEIHNLLTNLVSLLWLRIQGKSGSSVSILGRKRH